MAHAKSTDPNVFILPDLGEGVHEAEMIAWRVKVGDKVNEHDILAEMETDKALVEVPSPRAGTIKILHGKEGEILHVGNPLVTYEGQGQDQEAPATAPAARSGADEHEDAGTVVGAMSDDMPGITRRNGKALAAPAVRRLARDLGVDINLVAGTGIAGRVTAKDVRQAAQRGPAQPAQSQAAAPSAASVRPMQADAPRHAPAPAAPNAAAPSAPALRAPGHTPAPSHRRPLPSPAFPAPAYSPQPGFAQPAYPQSAYPQPAYPQVAYPQPMPMPYGIPVMSPYGVPMMLVPMPMPPMPYGYAMPGASPDPAGLPHAGLPHAPGFVPFPSGRPVPDPAQTAQPGARLAFRGVRRTIAQRLRDSVNTAVHFTVVDEADVTELDALRLELSRSSGVKLSFLPLVARAVTMALTGRFGALNATVDDAAQEIVQHGPVHLGIATDTDSGLMVPVIPDAHALDPVALGRAIADTARAARERTLPRERLMGSTFTISNVGSHAGRFATPVINYPEVAILAVGKAYDGVVVRDGRAAVAKVLPLSLACDHRVVDGATAALGLAEIVARLSDPASLV